MRTASADDITDSTVARAPRMASGLGRQRGLNVTPALDTPPLLPVAATGQLRLGTLTLIRWVAVLGQAGALLVVYFGLGFELPLGPAMTVVGASALLNFVLALRRPAGARLSDRAAALFLAYDIGQLAVLLYMTGGLENPFALLLLAPITVSATILSLRSTLALCAFSLICIAVLAVWHLPLPWSTPGFSLPPIYVLGGWISLALGIIFFASYTWRVAQEARRMSDALAATQLALAREQQLSALGGLAAAAAHELGSPLGTIAVAAREIARDLPPDSPHAEDVNLLISETARCRDILAELAHRPEDDANSPLTLLPLSALVETAAAPHLEDRIDFRIDAAARESGEPIDAPQIVRSPELIHGLGNLIQNAVQFARTRVDVAIEWDQSEIVMVIFDDGRGFPARVLEQIGEPYVSLRAPQKQHMGLGIFIAKTLLQRTGADIVFDNRREGGARVAVRWPRAALERMAQEQESQNVG